MSAPLPLAAQVFLAFPEDYPAANLAAALADFAGTVGLVQVQHTEWVPAAGPAWAEPTAITAYLSAAFVASLRPGGATADTSALLVGLLRLAKRSHAAASARAAGLLGGRYQQSAEFSIVARGQGGQRLKMLFDTGLGPAAWAAAIAETLPVVAAHYLQAAAPSARPAALIEGPTPTLYLVHHRERRIWELQNDASMQALHRKA